MRQQKPEHGRRFLAEEALRGGGSVGATNEIVVYGCQGAELAFAEPMGALMMEGQLPVAPLHAGATALKEVGAFAGDPLDLLARGVIEHCEH